MPLEIVVLAAGQGTRMRSALSKVLHPIGGRPMLQRVIDAARALEPARIHVVTRPDAEQIRDLIEGPVSWVHQTEQLGTGHAVAQAMPAIAEGSTVLVLFGDVPLVNPKTIRRCADVAVQGQLGVVTARFADPAELGRIVRGVDGNIERIVEYKDANPSERKIDEINSGIMAAPRRLMAEFFATMRNDNAQNEYYMTDIVPYATDHGVTVVGIQAASEIEVAGVNNRAQLAEVERAWQQASARELMLAGVTLADPLRFDVRGRITTGRDVFIDINCVLLGEVVLGDDVSIGPNVTITNSRIGAGVRIEPNTVIDGAVIEAKCTIGPFARIRPGSQLSEGVHIGNFVETKKAHLGQGTKANHLAYLGDTTIGSGCNIGAGTITCNYDGFAKHHTEIGNGVFVGSNATLVAPVELEDDAFVAAGSTVTSRVERGDLAVGRGKQRNIKGWIPPHRRTAHQKE
jgi:bifunctional UDP-N-acetylglucosamine pyrophosphorylase/glucosamine-1-phosphate N-acetyltransferase